MADSSCVLPLPPSLVLLLHLHILSYPQCNAPEYSPATLFSPSRPLRDRTKTMEDIIAFLIEKIEGKAKCKSILGGTYPCLQPSDTVAFRVNAAKYMETLRTTVTRQGLQVSTSKGRMPGGKPLHSESASSKAKSSTSSQHGLSSSKTCSSAHETSPIAWWWSAIVIRKSLLEESSGDRFEKLLLALSTHALFVQVPSSSSLHPVNTTTPEMTNGLRIQSPEYAKLLSQSLGLQAERAQSVSRLNIYTEKFISRRARLALTPRDDGERVDLQQLLAIRNSKRQDLVDAWQTIPHTGILGTNEEQSMSASDALKWISSIAGISTGDAQREAPPSFTEPFPPDVGISLQDSDSVIVQSLPIASAHHPANSYKLRSLPSFVSLHSDLFTYETSDSGSAMTSPTLQELLHGASSQKAALEAALDSAITAGRNIACRLDITLKTAAAAQEREGLRELNLGIPPVNHTVLDSKVSPMQDPGTMGSSSETSNSSSMTHDTQQRNEASILALRNAFHSRIPSRSISDADHSHTVKLLQHASPAAFTRQQSSKIPLATAAFTSSTSQSTSSATHSSHQIPMIPISSRPYVTSTPAPKSQSKTIRAIQVAESKGSDADDALLTPTNSHGFTTGRKDTMETPPPRRMIADMSLPDFSDGGTIDLRKVPPKESALNGDKRDVPGLEEVDIPYEGHSVTLRDILLRAGAGEDSFHLIDDFEDLGEHLGNETMGWG